MKECTKSLWGSLTCWSSRNISRGIDYSIACSIHRIHQTNLSQAKALNQGTSWELWPSFAACIYEERKIFSTPTLFLTPLYSTHHGRTSWLRHQKLRETHKQLEQRSHSISKPLLLIILQAITRLHCLCSSNTQQSMCPGHEHLSIKCSPHQDAHTAGERKGEKGHCPVRSAGCIRSSHWTCQSRDGR